METLPGLEWSAGLFGLAIGMVIGCIATWFGMRGNAPAVELPGSFDEFVPAGDVPAVPREMPAFNGNLLVRRMFERWLDADSHGDRVGKYRQEMRMLGAGIDLPLTRTDAERYLATLKGETP